MTTYYSKETGGFYVSSVHGKSIPHDSVKIDDKLRIELLDGISKGMLIETDDSGIPFLKNTPPARTNEILYLVKSEIRALREPMLSAVTGIGWEASEAGDAALVQEARDIRNALRDITDDPALNAAQTYEDMRAAGVAAYRRIAASASPAFAATFKDFTGS